jgi:hypothetical protein
LANGTTKRYVGGVLQNPDMGRLPVPGGAWDDDTNHRLQDLLKKPPRGIFGEWPAATPKYATNTGEIKGDYRETMARMFIQVGPAEYEKFVASVKENDPTNEVLARVLAGTNLTFGSPNSNTGTGYIDFLLQNVQHQFQEKMQIIETLSDSYVAYFFGQGAPIFQYSGILVNSKQDDQVHNMIRIYQSMIRGYQLARRKKLVRIRYNGMIVNGAAINFGFNLAAENEMACPFNFGFLVKSIIQLQNPEFGIVVPDTLFATTSELTAAGFTNGVLPGAVVEITGGQPVMANMDAPVPLTDKELAAKVMADKAQLDTNRIDLNTNVGDAARAANALVTADNFVAQARAQAKAEVEAAKVPVSENPLYGDVVKDLQVATP